MSMSFVTVDLAAIAHNVQLLRKGLPESTQMIAVVKADAYGHGFFPIAQTALRHGATRLAVANVEEGMELRQAGLADAPILVLGGTLPRQAQDAVDFHLAQTIFTPAMAEALEAAAVRVRGKALAHLKIETGMNRLGVRPGQPLEEVLHALRRCPHVELEGMYSHLAVSDCDDAYTRAQYAVFEQAARQVKAAGFSPMLHLSNSAAALSPQYDKLDAVRFGIGLYGLDPVQKGTYDLRPALSWHTQVAWVHDVAPGETVGYGRTFPAERPTRVATIPVGYADGYRRALSNVGQVLLKGARAPIIGRVCMDQCMVDVTDLADVNLGDDVVLLGRQGMEEITADEMAAWCDTIHYEIVTCIGKRVPRTYLHG